MSCRVLGRGVETAMLAGDRRTAPAQPSRARSSRTYRATDRNAMVADLFARARLRAAPARRDRRRADVRAARRQRRSTCPHHIIVRSADRDPGLRLVRLLRRACCRCWSCSCRCCAARRAAATPVRLVFIARRLYLLFLIAPRLALFHLVIWRGGRRVAASLSPPPASAGRGVAVLWASLVVVLAPMIAVEGLADRLRDRVQRVDQSGRQRDRRRGWQAIDFTAEVDRSDRAVVRCLPRRRSADQEQPRAGRPAAPGRVLAYGLFPPLLVVGPIASYDETAKHARPSRRARPAPRRRRRHADPDRPVQGVRDRLPARLVGRHLRRLRRSTRRGGSGIGADRLRLVLLRQLRRLLRPRHRLGRRCSVPTCDPTSTGRIQQTDPSRVLEQLAHQPHPLPAHQRVHADRRRPPATPVLRDDRDDDADRALARHHVGDGGVRALPRRLAGAAP